MYAIKRNGQVVFVGPYSRVDHFFRLWVLCGGDATELWIAFPGNY